MLLAITIISVGLSALLVTGQNDSISGDGSGMFDNSVTLLNPTSTTLIIAPSTSAAGIISPSPLIGTTSDYITSEQSALFVGNQCSCDLSVGSCDPNCCCDNDCTNQIGTFTECIDIRDNQDDRMCISDDAIVRSSVSLRTEHVTDNNDNLFCVYRDNNPSRQEYSSIDPITSKASVQNLINVHAHQGDLLYASEQGDLNLDASFYKVDDPILAMRNGLLAHMILPHPLNSGQCGYQNPIGYLQSSKVSCEYHMTSHDWCTSSVNIQMSSFTELLVLKLPSQPDTVMINAVCYNVTGSVVNCAAVAMPTNDTDYCNNVLMELEYHITDNGTDGIIDIDAIVVVDNVPLVTTTITQLFSVQFLQSTPVANILHRSGSHGYQTGEPVLAGNELTGRILLNSDSSDWLVVANSNQDCETASKTPVLFGEDVDTSCDLNITDSSDDCSQMAAMTTNFFTTFNKQYIGSYGNANPDQLSQWIDVIGYNESLDDVATGSYNSCVGIPTTQQLLVFFSYAGDASYPDVKIVGAQYSYVTATVVTQKCSGLTCHQDRYITLRSHVSFIGVSDTPTTILKRTTNIIRRLPDDFFYPFLSHAPSTSCCTRLVLLLVTTSILIGCL